MKLGILSSFISSIKAVDQKLQGKKDLNHASQSQVVNTAQPMRQSKTIFQRDGGYKQGKTSSPTHSTCPTYRIGCTCVIRLHQINLRQAADTPLSLAHICERVCSRQSLANRRTHYQRHVSEYFSAVVQITKGKSTIVSTRKLDNA